MQNKGRLAMIVKEETEAGANGLAHIDNTVSFRKKDENIKLFVSDEENKSMREEMMCMNNENTSRV
jgi:hypothetical protein